MPRCDIGPFTFRFGKQKLSKKIKNKNNNNKPHTVHRMSAARARLMWAPESGRARYLTVRKLGTTRAYHVAVADLGDSGLYYAPARWKI